MTTVYVPRVIRTDEEAEALPVGTVVIDSHQVPRIKDARFGWTNGCRSLADADVADRYMTALVPVEAEEERWEAGAIPDFLGITFRWSAARRYVTEWEDAR